MYKSFLIAVALIAPIMGQDTTPTPPSAPAASAHHGDGAHRGDMVRTHIARMLVMDKYDANKDGKLDDTEKAVVKAEADKLRQARRAEMLAKFDKDSDGKLSDEEKKAMRAAREARPEGKKGEGKRGEGKKHGEGKHHEGEGKGHGDHAHAAPDRDVMMVGMALFMEKYDTDKDGKISKEERAAVKTDAEAAHKAHAEKAHAAGAEATKE